MRVFLIFLRFLLDRIVGFGRGLGFNEAAIFKSAADNRYERS